MIRLFWAISTLSFIYCNADIPIERESFICTETSELVDFGQSCKDFTNYEEKKSCNIIKNSINIMRGDTDNEDEFRVVFEMNSEQVFYFKSPNVHKTECTKVEKFFVIGDFDQCTKHLAVKYTFFNGTEKLGFYSKNGILRKFGPTRACEKKQRRSSI